ncbi:MAG: hypothetical protein ACPGSD_02365 [Flavobacteriales bacterium]
MLKHITILLLTTLVFSCSSSDSETEMQKPCPVIIGSGIDCLYQDTDFESHLNGFKSFYFSTGDIKSEGNLTQGIPNGFWKIYNENGSISREGNYTQGRLNGFWKVFWENGNIREEGNYNQCTKTGFWKYYFESKNHQVQFEGNYHSGNQTGAWKTYDSSGALIEDIDC